MIPGIGSGSGSSGNPLASVTSAKNQFVSQQTFLTLLITQLKHQNPLNPQDSSQFVAQLAQFSSLEQMAQMNKNITNVLESSVTNLIGKSVTVTDPVAPKGFVQGAVTGVVYYKDGPSVRVNGKDYPLSAIQSVF